MLFLQFQLGQDRYVLEAGRVVEVLPLVDMKQIPHAPQGVLGLFNYRGHPVPAVDLVMLAAGHPSSGHLSTRIILVEYPDGRGRQRLLGLVAERATSIIRRESRDFVDSGVPAGHLPYLGPVIPDDQGGIIQWVREQQLLPEAVRDLLFDKPKGTVA